MVKHARICCNPRFGLVGFDSVPALLVYELLSPVIEIAGLAITALAALFGHINLPSMLMFLAIYAIFGAVMSLNAFACRAYRPATSASPPTCSAPRTCPLEVTVLRFFMSSAL